MKIIFTTRDSRTHAIQLNGADYGLSDLMGFHKFTLEQPNSASSARSK
jgi:hypothetical protein